MRIPSGTTDQYLYFVAVDATDLKTRETGLSSFTVVRSRNGAADATFTTPTVTEIDNTTMPGVYALLLDEDMTIDSGNDSEEMVVHITHAGMAPVTRSFELYRPKSTIGTTLSVESDGDLTKVNTLDGHTPQTGDAFARIGAPVGASLSADLQVVDGNVDDVETALTSALGGLAAFGNLVITAGTIGDTGNDTTHLHLPSLTFGDDEINALVIVVYDVSGAERHRRIITDWVNATKLATLDVALPFTPEDSTDTFGILAASPNVNVTQINDVPIIGDGQPGTEFGVA